MKTEFLQLEVELLLVKYGESSVLKTLALALHSTEDDIRNRVAELRAKKKKTNQVPRAKKMPLGIAKGVIVGKENEDLLAQLATLYQNKKYLPQLREVKRFLGRFNIAKTIKSRNDATRLVFESLCQCTREELNNFIADASSGDQSAFAKLADHIMGNSGKKISTG